MTDRFSKSCASEFFPNQGVLSDLLSGQRHTWGLGGIARTTAQNATATTGKPKKVDDDPDGEKLLRGNTACHVALGYCGHVEVVETSVGESKFWSSTMMIDGTSVSKVDMFDFISEIDQLLLTFQFSSPFCQT